MLKGYRTYITVVVGVILNFCVYMKWISPDNLLQINTILGFLGLGFLRAK